MSAVLVSISIPDVEQFEKTVIAAKKVGFRVNRALDILGVATGSIEESALPALRRLPGVDSVEPDREVSIPGPSSDRKRR
jgi:hypothetical protein